MTCVFFLLPLARASFKPYRRRNRDYLKVRSFQSALAASISRHSELSLGLKCWQKGLGNLASTLTAAGARERFELLSVELFLEYEIVGLTFLRGGDRGGSV